MKLLRYSLLGVCIFLLSSFNPLGSPNAWLQGTWKGIGFQPDSPTEGHSWTMEFTANVEANDYRIYYPSIPCSGKWEITHTRKESVVFKEIVVEKSACYDQGKVIVTYVDDNRISFSWFYQNSNRLGAYATLIKQK